MIFARIDGATRTCGRSQGYAGLPIRDETVHLEGIGDTPFMVSAWEPTPAEQTRLAAGAKVVIWIAGSSPPPMRVEVGELPSDLEGPEVALHP